MVRVLIVEHERLLRDAIEQSLEREGFRTKTVGDAAGARSALRRWTFEMVILDASLPDEPGLDVLAELRAAGSTSHVTVLSAAGGESERVRILHLLGADDFLAKPFFLRELTARLLATRRRLQSTQPATLSFPPLSIDTESRQVTVGGESRELTTKEFDLLVYLASHPGKVLSRDALLRAVWDSGSDLQQASTVTEHVRRLRLKIDDDPRRAPYLATVRGIGYRFTRAAGVDRDTTGGRCPTTFDRRPGARPVDLDLLIAAAVERVRRVGIDAAVDMLADLQREVGRRWERGEGTIVDEHSLTAMTEAALLASAQEARPVADDRGTLIAACVEGEGHTLPARMFVERLRARGWRVDYLGGTLPAEDLGAYVEESGAIAVALSCTSVVNLAAARNSMLACQAAGATVIAGGAAFGSDEERALALGADAWAPDADTVSRLLEAAPALRRGGGVASGRERSFLALDDLRPAIVEAAALRLAFAGPATAATTGRTNASRLRTEIDLIVRLVGCAILTGDDSVVTDDTGWIRAGLTTAGLLPWGITGLLGSIHDLVPGTMPEARRLFEVMSAARRASPTTVTGHLLLTGAGSTVPGCYAPPQALPT